MFNKYRHFYLYAKSHYKQNDIVEDLKKIAGNYTGSSPESEKVSDIMTILTDAMNDLFKNDPNAFRKFSDVYLRNTVELRGFNCEIRSSHLAYIHTCMNIMGHTKVCDIEGDLGEDDYSILPCHEWNRGV